jgi:hypothetical protein
VTTPSTLTQVLSDVWVGPDSGLVVGRGGTILRLRGRTATEMSSGTTADLYAVWGFADGTAVAAGAAGTVLRFDGTRWNAITGAGATDVFSDVWGTSARDFFAVVRGGRVFRYNGTALTGVPALGASETGSPSIRLSGTSNENLYAAGFGVYAFDAASWSMIAVAPITGTSAGSLFATPNDLLYGTFYGGVFARRTRTSPWRPLVLAPIHRSVWVAPSGRAYVGSEAGRLVRIDGSAFEDLPSDSARQTPIHGVWSASSENEIHAVGNRFLGVYDGGRLRSARPTTVTTRNYYAVHGSAANNVFAVGTGIARFDGTSWSEVVIPGAAAATDTLADVWVVSPTFAVAVGSVGSSQVLKWDGTQWTRETIPFAGISAQSVYSTGPNAIFVGSADGRVFRWDGRTWAADMVGAGTTCRITDIWGKDASDVYVTTACGDIHAWNGTGWSRPFDGPVNTTLYSIYGVPGIGGIAVGSGAITVRGRP